MCSKDGTRRLWWRETVTSSSCVATSSSIRSVLAWSRRPRSTAGAATEPRRDEGKEPRGSGGEKGAGLELSLFGKIRVGLAYPSNRPDRRGLHMSITPIGCSYSEALSTGRGGFPPPPAPLLPQ